MNIKAKDDYHLIIKRVLKVIFAIVFIKLLRVVMIKNEQINSTINELFSIAPLEEMFRFIAINMVVIGTVGLLITFLYKGKDLLKSKLFSFLFFFCLIDAIFIYVFPEIPAAVTRVVFLE